MSTRQDKPTALTDPAIQKYKPAKARRRIRDLKSQSLFLVIETSGSKHFEMRFRRPDGRPAKLRLGKYSDRELEGAPVVGSLQTLASARWLAADVLRRRKLGEDVIGEHKAEKRRRAVESAESSERVFPVMVRSFVARYKTKKHQSKPRQWRQTAGLLGFDYPKDGGGSEPQIIKGGLAERWCERDVRQISEDDIWDVVNEARDRGVPGHARRNDEASGPRARAMFAALSVFFGWLRRERLIAVNPLAGLDRPSAPAARKRTLSMDEIRWFWHATETVDAPVSPGAPKPFKPLLRLLLLTGARLNEVARMARDELGDDGMWRLSGERTKNGKPHIVPLPPLARELLAGLPRRGDFVFSTTGSTPVSGWSRTKQRLDAKMLALARKERGDKFTIPPWRLHDLRRTFSTELHGLKIAPHVVEACLNHISGHKAGVAGTYNQYEYYDEKHDAMERWARWIALVIDRDLYAKYEQRLAGGNDETKTKAKKIFVEAIAEGGSRWKRYLASVANGGSANVVELPTARQGGAA